MGLEGKQPLVSCKPSVAKISSPNIAANRQLLENTVEDFHHKEKCILVFKRKLPTLGWYLKQLGARMVRLLSIDRDGMIQSKIRQ